MNGFQTFRMLLLLQEEDMDSVFPRVFVAFLLAVWTIWAQQRSLD